MLEELCKKDDYWRKVAYRICKDRMIADDLVQEMYIKVYSLDKAKVLNEWYITIIIRNIYIDNYNEDKNLKPLNEFDEPINVDFFEFNHKTKKQVKEEQVVNNLTWWQKEVITMTHDKSFHEIQRETNLNYQFVRRTLIKAQTNGKTA